MKYAEQGEGKERQERGVDLLSHSRTRRCPGARKSGWQRIFVIGMSVTAGVLLCRDFHWRQPWNVAVTEAFATECEGELPEDADLPEVAIGERLFLETRFAQFFFVNAKGNANAILPAGDPVMDTTQTTGTPLPGPFAGQAMNCRNCHFVDEHLGQEGLPGSGVRTYADFARRSPVPQREDGKVTTPRNSPPLVNASLARKGGVLFRSHGRLSEEELVLRTIAVFKTASLRDLAQSAPYLHTGGKDTLDDVIRFYLNMADLVRTGKMRNPDPEIGRISLTPEDILSLRAFLRALTEDYS